MPPPWPRANTLLKEAAKDPKLVNVRYASLEDAPVYAVKVDDAKAQARWA